ncbi:Ig-like domain-containing protein [Nocardioides sp. 1609]|uniref:Ig-like domain-containing protein n=1 Tax=Nocardioides sp. 1609 TaxID=2508327 RepID=UPI00106F8A1C|nr:Ig-like domain-containing protein [Nocardioides sp. 1609]
MHRRLTAALTAAATALVLVTSVVPAHADESTDAPVVENDRVRVEGSGAAFVDVLANDTDPNGDVLEICRVRVPSRAPLDVSELSGEEIGVDGEALAIFPTRNRPGTYEITYWACDEGYLRPGTLTVVVVKVKEVKVTKVPGRPGTLRIANPGSRRVVVYYGSFREGEPDGRVSVPARAAKRIRVERPRIDYVAYYPRTGSDAGHGTVRGIDLGRAGAHRGVPYVATPRDLERWHRTS